MKIHVYAYDWTGSVWYYETAVQNDGNFSSQAAALKAARAAVDKHLEKEAAKP